MKKFKDLSYTQKTVLGLRISNWLNIFSIGYNTFKLLEKDKFGDYTLDRETSDKRQVNHKLLLIGVSQVSNIVNSALIIWLKNKDK